MDYITKIFDRLDLQNIKAHLVDGGELIIRSNLSYRERLEVSYQELTGILRKSLPDEGACERVSDGIVSYACVVEDVYMEIGMQCGAQLMLQLLSDH